MDACTHHFVLGAPENGTILGRCKKCEVERQFPSQLEGTDRGNDYQEAASGPLIGRNWSPEAA